MYRKEEDTKLGNYLNMIHLNIFMSDKNVYDKLLNRVIERVDTVISVNKNGSKPEPIDGMIPDVIGIIDGEEVIIQIVTCETINTEDTKKRYKAFSKVGKKFRVYTPKNCSLDALRITKEEEIKNIKFYYFKDI